jgi:hypothetical protein
VGGLPLNEFRRMANFLLPSNKKEMGKGTDTKTAVVKRSRHGKSCNVHSLLQKWLLAITVSGILHCEKVPVMNSSSLEFTKYDML